MNRAGASAPPRAAISRCACDALTTTTGIFGSVGAVAKSLVKDSFEYTFIRPVGNFDYELGTWGKEAPPISENSRSRIK